MFTERPAGSPIAVREKLLDQRPTPPRWRSYLPASVRGLTWADEASTFAAFLFYSWKADTQVAPLVQMSLQRFLCAWYKLGALNIFRDLSCLAASSSLSGSVAAKLDQSQHLIVLATGTVPRSRKPCTS